MKSSKNVTSDRERDPEVRNMLFNEMRESRKCTINKVVGKYLHKSKRTTEDEMRSNIDFEIMKAANNYYDWLQDNKNVERSWNAYTDAYIRGGATHHIRSIRIDNWSLFSERESPVTVKDDDDGYEPDYAAMDDSDRYDHESDQSVSDKREVMETIMSKIKDIVDETEWQILYHSFLTEEKKTLAQIGELIGYPASTVCVMRQKALDNLRRSGDLNLLDELYNGK
jgi:DNA-directed RNA polymerase specialized sigma subunit